MKKILIIAMIATSCTSIVYDKAVIYSVSNGNDKYLYRVEINCFPVNTVIYTNDKYYVGDTLNVCK